MFEVLTRGENGSWWMRDQIHGRVFDTREDAAEYAAHLLATDTGAGEARIVALGEAEEVKARSCGVCGLNLTGTKPAEGVAT